MSFHWNSSSTAAPALLTPQFEIQPQEALMCFQVNNFSRSSLRGDLLISVPLRKRQGITLRNKNTVRNYVHPFSIGAVKQVTNLPGSKMFSSYYSRSAQHLYSYVHWTFLISDARCRYMEQRVWQPWRWLMVRPLCEETGQEPKQRWIISRFDVL